MKKPDHGVLNLAQLAAGWMSFLIAFITLAHIPYGTWLIPLISLAFLQFLAGVIHEAVHYQLYRANLRINEQVGNWAAAFVFGYDLSSYRQEHFHHHGSKVFLHPSDRETAAIRAVSRHEMVRGVLNDLFLVTVIRMVQVRLGPLFTGKEAGSVRYCTPFSYILLHAALLWGVMLLAASFKAVALFWITFFTLYPLANRIRGYATHGDFVHGTGTADTEVAVNVHSPVYERIFFGNRMLMYHHEHHLHPNLPFRAAEELARKRKAQVPVCEENGKIISIPSYLYAMKALMNRAVGG